MFFDDEDTDMPQDGGMADNGDETGDSAEGGEQM